MEKPVIKKENVVSKFDGRFVRVYDLQYAPGKHYYDATRRDIDHLVAIKSDEEFKGMLPDAVSCALILNIKGQEPLLYLSYEYRYPTGQYLLSVPAGLMDKDDRDVLETARREIKEETGITIEESDALTVVNPLVFSTPGMSDESNAFVQVVIQRDEMPDMNQEGAEGSELFDGYVLLNKEEAKEILMKGRDENNNFYSVFTWMGLMCFVSDLWK
ncbi:MAG: NUDIX hydrolase [Erysipelotrichaceae bacterium]|nr:NUDIX hydrolase [Erysipelotrichaceae bacterium]